MTAKIGVISLGCDKNRVDTEVMLAHIRNCGYLITADIKEADVIIINTCAFIEISKKEAIDTIFECVNEKNIRDVKIIVTGCLPERYKNELVDSLPEVDAFIGIAEYSKIGEVIANVLLNNKTVDFSPCDLPSFERILTTPYHYAYLKIADGCDNHCTYCAIPLIRGKYRSRDIDSLVDEAKFLIDEYGVRELNLVAQDVTRYGIDIYDEYSLLKLLDKLSRLNITWIRLLYCYPELMTENLIKFIEDNEKICKYVDIPLQHINDRILKLMGRRTSSFEIKKLIERLRIGNIAIRSTFIVGFPSESDEEYQQLYDFIENYKLNYAGFFSYSREEGTPAAKLKNQIELKTKQSRLKEISSLQSSVIFDNNRSYYGKTFKVLYEGIDFDKQIFYGRPEFCAPEVDAKIYFKSVVPVNVGEFYDVKIIDSDGYDLIGEIK